MALIDWSTILYVEIIAYISQFRISFGRKYGIKDVLFDGTMIRNLIDHKK